MRRPARTSTRDSCPCWRARKEIPRGPLHLDPTAAYQLLCRVVRPSGRYVAAATSPPPQFGLDKWRLRVSEPPAHPDTTRSAPPIAAVVRESVARPEPAPARQIGRPAQRTLLAR